MNAENDSTLTPARDFTRDRERMVEFQIAGRGIKDPHVLAAFRTVPREMFVPEGMQDLAYEDGPLPIGEGQTTSQPYVVALMIEAAGIRPGDRVLEIGAGSGYASAVMSRIAAEVYAIERLPSLSEQAQQRFDRLHYDNIHLRTGDGTKGWPEAAPFNAILVAASGPEVPSALKEQLAIGGRLIMPVSMRLWRQSLRKITRISETKYEDENLGAVAFVPLIGEHGWKASIPDGTNNPGRADTSL